MPTRKTFQDRKIRTGPRGGKYILKGGKKMYLSGGLACSKYRKTKDPKCEEQDGCQWVKGKGCTGRSNAKKKAVKKSETGDSMKKAKTVKKASVKKAKTVREEATAVKIYIDTVESADVDTIKNKMNNLFVDPKQGHMSMWADISYSEHAPKIKLNREIKNEYDETYLEYTMHVYGMIDPPTEDLKNEAFDRFLRMLKISNKYYVDFEKFKMDKYRYQNAYQKKLKNVPDFKTKRPSIANTKIEKSKALKFKLTITKEYLPEHPLESIPYSEKLRKAVIKYINDYQPIAERSYYFTKFDIKALKETKNVKFHNKTIKALVFEIKYTSPFKAIEQFILNYLRSIFNTRGDTHLPGFWKPAESVTKWKDFPYTIVVFGYNQ